ncbi:unnamed protein product [Rotaria sp. Silwood1]|nr:unnamed protein product [Rotaria sp. Silwood1]
MDQLTIHSCLILLVFSSIDIVAVQSTKDGWPFSASGLVQTNWTGTWHGVIEAYPEGQLGDGWHKTLVIGPYPMTDETCTILNGTFTEHGVLQLTKDYRFCRGHGATDLYIDAGNGAILAVQWINAVLITAFKHNGVFTVSSIRMRGDTLEEEIIIADDKPGAENNVVSMRTHSIHFIKMKRITN